MADLFPILVPLINTNETESMLAHLEVNEGQKVKKGDLIAEFETTKSTFEVLAEQDGFVLGIQAKEGDQLKIGELLCYIADRADARLPEKKKEISQVNEQDKSEIPDGLRITQPALAFARKHNINLSTFSKDQLITEKMLEGLIGVRNLEVDEKAVIIYGGGGHANSLIDLIRAEGIYHIVGIVDDGITAGEFILNIPVLGGGDCLAELRGRGIVHAINAVGGIGNISPRLRVFETLEKEGFTCPTVIHPRAFVEPTAKVGEGCQIFYNAYVGSDAVVDFGCIINTGSILSHDCVLEKYVNVSPGAILAGKVTVRQRTLIGMGVTVNLNVVIGSDVRIGNSAVIKADVADQTIVRAGTIWPNS